MVDATRPTVALLRARRDPPAILTGRLTQQAPEYEF
jgi:hypothetical protein